MSSIMNYTLSLNTITTCATAICTAEIVFRKWGIRYFSEDSMLGRAILHGLDISQYLLGTAGLLSYENGKSIDSGKILVICIYLPLPLISKSVCYLTNSKSKIYQIGNALVQTLRVSAKFCCFLYSIASLSKTKPDVTTQLTYGGKIAVLGFALIGDTVTVLRDYAPNQPKDFYKFLRQRA